MRSLVFEVPIQVKRGLNDREHWAVRMKRVKAERQATMYRFKKAVRSNTIRPLLVVTLTRVSPRELDDDGVVGALKGVRDQVASCLRVDDRTALIQWEYAQRKGKPGVEVRIEQLEGAEMFGQGDAST